MILLQNVTKRYKNKLILDNVNLRIDRAGLYLVKGDNGVGKSTLLNIIGGFTKVKGKVINNYKKNMGYVFQNSFLIDELKVKDNLEAFNIKREVLSEYKMDDKVDEYVYNLSMGERQRLAFIIATREENQLILLDEVLANLDNDNAKIIVNKILELKNERIIILVSHKYNQLQQYVDVLLEIKDNDIKYIDTNTSDRLLITNKREKKKLKLEVRVNYKLYFCYLVTLLLFLFFVIVSNLTNNFINKDILNTVDYNKFYLKECIDINNEGFIISRCGNPDESKLRTLNEHDIRYGFNYDYLLVNVYNNENLSVINNKNVNLNSGRYPREYNEVITSSNYNLGDKIILKPNLIIGSDKIDVYTQELVLEVVGIYNDLLFMKDNKIYLDYFLIDEFYKHELLRNNEISLYDYFYNLDIPSYKYLSFTDEFIDIVKFEGATYSYYEGIKDIFIKVDDLLKYIEIGCVIFFLYLLVKIYRVRLVELQKNICFLMANSFTKREVIECYFKRDFLFFLFTFIITLIILVFFHPSIIDLMRFIMIILVIIITLVSLISVYFSRRAISRLMLEEVW